MRKYLLASAALASTLVGCNSISGILDVAVPLEAVSNKDELIQLSSGTQESEIDISRNRKKLKLKVMDQNGDSHKITLENPSGKFPKQQGEFKLYADEIGQNWDFHGRLDHKVDYSPWDVRWSRCTYYEREYRCYYHNGEKRCRWVRFQRRGWRQVEYRFMKEELLARAKVLEEGTGGILARFRGTRVDTHRQTGRVGHCRR